MNLNNLFITLAGHPILAGILGALLVAVLHLPYRYTFKRDRKGYEHVVYLSVMYRYAYGPDYERLDHYGMQLFQRVVLALLRDGWVQLRGDLLRRLLDAVRRRLGW